MFGNHSVLFCSVLGKKKEKIIIIIFGGSNSRSPFIVSTSSQLDNNHQRGHRGHDLGVCVIDGTMVVFFASIISWSKRYHVSAHYKAELAMKSASMLESQARPQYGRQPGLQPECSLTLD